MPTTNEPDALEAFYRLDGVLVASMVDDPKAIRECVMRILEKIEEKAMKYEGI